MLWSSGFSTGPLLPRKRIVLAAENGISCLSSGESGRRPYHLQESQEVVVATDFIITSNRSLSYCLFGGSSLDSFHISLELLLRVGFPKKLFSRALY